MGRVKLACGVRQATRSSAKLIGSGEQRSRPTAHGHHKVPGKHARRGPAQENCRRENSPDQIPDRRLPDGSGHEQQHETSTEVISNRAIEIDDGGTGGRRRNNPPQRSRSHGQATTITFPKTANFRRQRRWKIKTLNPNVASGCTPPWFFE